MSSATKAKILEAYGKLPLYFIQNDGQIDSRVKYYEKGSGHAMYLTEEGVYLSLIRHSKEEKTEPKTIKLSFLNANPKPKLIAEGKLEGKVNYFIGNDPKKWKTDIPTYSSVVYKGVYEGIDIRFYGNQRQLEYDIVVKPGADPSKVRLVYEGIEGLRITDRGDLEVLLDKDSFLIQHKPVVYQEVDGKRRFLEGDFVILEKDPTKKKAVYAFKVFDYDRTKPLIIDPVLVYSTYLGGSDDDRGLGIAVDSSGNAYVTGYTWSDNFPTQNAYDSSYNGNDDAFVTKLGEEYTFNISPVPSNGKITANGISCGSGGNDCSEAYSPGATVTLTATPNVGFVFLGWTGDCAMCGTSSVCGITINSNMTCSANFGVGTTNHSFTISKSGTGSGTVTSNSPDLNCGNNCTVYFPHGASLTLTAVPDSGSNFGGWSGDCSSCGNNTTCTVIVDGDKTCVAIFNSSSAGGGGGGCSMGSGISPVNALMWLILPVFALARRIRRR